MFTCPLMKASTNCAQLRNSTGFSTTTPSASNSLRLCATSSGVASVIGR